MHLILQRRTLPTKEQKMKQKESRELRNLSMGQLNAKLSELYKELPRRNPKYSFERPYRNHLLRQINQIKYEQTLRGKGVKVTRSLDRIRIHSPRNQVRKILFRISLLRIIPIQPPKRSSTPNTNKTMKRKPKTISKEKAIVIASNHNNLPIQIAKGYTESELREVLRHLNLKPGF